MVISPQLIEKASEPLYMQLYLYIKKEIQKATIICGARLPSIRQLSEDLQVSKTTVQMAYQQLLAEGYIENRDRSGYFVVELDHDAFSHLPNAQPIHLGEELATEKPKSVLYDFYMSSIDLDHFPYESWRKYTNLALHIEDKELLAYGDRQGEQGLRYEISQYLKQSRGVNCRKEQIVIGTGTQSVIQVLCQLIGLDGRAVAIENPGYRGARSVFQLFGYEMKPIALAEDGIHIEELTASEAKIVYITPSHQYPIGMVMPVAKRLKLLQWAEENNGLIIEDDYDGEFRYRGKPIPSLQGLDVHGHVVYVGTFSKSLMPAIRLSYMVLPNHLVDVYQQLFITFDQTVSRLHQRTLQLFMESGEWERHVRKMRTLYHKKHTILLESIKSMMKNHVIVTGQDAGLHIVIEVKSDLTADELVQIAADAGIKVYSTTHTWYKQPEGEPSLILLGFGGLTIEEIKRGISALNTIWEPYYL